MAAEGCTATTGLFGGSWASSVAKSLFPAGRPSLGFPRLAAEGGVAAERSAVAASCPAAEKSFPMGPPCPAASRRVLAGFWCLAVRWATMPGQSARWYHKLSLPRLRARTNRSIASHDSGYPRLRSAGPSAGARSIGRMCWQRKRSRRPRNGRRNCVFVVGFYTSDHRAAGPEGDFRNGRHPYSVPNSYLNSRGTIEHQILYNHPQAATFDCGRRL